MLWLDGNCRRSASANTAARHMDGRGAVGRAPTSSSSSSGRRHGAASSQPGGRSHGARLDGRGEARGERVCRQVWVLRQQLRLAAGAQQDAVAHGVGARLCCRRRVGGWGGGMDGGQGSSRCGASGAGGQAACVAGCASGPAPLLGCQIRKEGSDPAACQSAAARGARGPAPLTKAARQLARQPAAARRRCSRRLVLQVTALQLLLPLEHELLRPRSRGVGGEGGHRVGRSVGNRAEGGRDRGLHAACCSPRGENKE